MRTSLRKTLFTATLVFAILNLGAATTEIEKIDPWPSDISHGDYIHVDADIEEPENGVSSAWFEISNGEETVGRGTLSDSNNDGYYISPAGTQVSGGETYQVKVNACHSSDECVSKTTTIRAECSLELLGECLN